MSAEPIAIVGSGCRFPGAATSPSKLWELLREPRDLTKKIPTERFDPDGFYHPDGTHHGTTNVKHAYLLEEDHRHFDTQFFQTKPMEANSIDPQQRLLLETVYEAVEGAGLKLYDMQGTDTAVYVGVMGGDYNDLILKDLDSIPTYLSTGTARSILSNRISYFFDWHGPSMTIDTACSSSLVAVHQAVQALQSGNSRVAVAAGANLILGPENFIAESKLKMLSPNGRSRMWDVDADGYARGDGFAAVILKKLSDALKDGDDIECIIRGSGVNQDGRTKGITMPSSTSQAALIRQVYANSGLDVRRPSDRCQYFEAHGTGTPAGDPIEAAAISSTFFEADSKASEGNDTLFVGSIKTVIGHTEGTAGLAGLLKASLAMRHGLIPPNLHLNRLNPSVEPFYKHLEIPTTLTPWPAVPDGTSRRASINSFGFGGTNAHVIIESYLPAPEKDATEVNEALLAPFNFSAPSEGALRRSIAAYLDYIKATQGETKLRDLAYTLACRRSAFAFKTSVGAVSVDSLAANLTAKLEDSESIGVQSATNQSQILGVFTGQGAQWAGMGRDLILSSQLVSNTIDRLEGYLSELPPADRPTWSLRAELLADAASSRLGEATLAQPLCTVVQIVLVDLLRIAKVKLAGVVGHSSGEIAAAYAAGYLSDRDALYISYYRGLHTRLAKGIHGEAGAMMAVGTTAEDAQQLCSFPEFQGRLSVAAVNSGTSVTLSGNADAIDEAKLIFQDEEKFARILKVDKAYHSNHMNACTDSYISSLADAKIEVQHRPNTGTSWFSSVYGALLPEGHASLEDVYWNTNMVSPVQFSQAISSAVAGKHFDIAIEIGPHPALQGPALQSIQEAGVEPIPYVGALQRGKNGLETVASALGFIWNHLGEGAVDFEALLALGSRQPTILKDLPQYPWEHDRIFWHESQLSKAFRTSSTPSHELLGARLPDGTAQELRWRNLLSLKEVPWLQGHQLQGAAVFPAAGYVAMALEAATHLTRNGTLKTVEVQDLVIARPITFDDEATGVETLFTLTDVHESVETAISSANFKCFTVPNKDSAAMVLTASGTLRLDLGEPSSSALPPKNSAPPNLVEVDTQRFYSSLAELGYGYTGPFKGLSAMKRKLGAGTGLVSNPASTDPENPLLIHPAMLDSAFQAVFLAYCWPGDGALWSLHVPTHIARIRVNAELARSAFAQPGEFPFDCILSPSPTSPIYGDVDIYPQSGGHAIVQVEGMSAVPVSAATPADDRKVFEDIVWGLASPDAESISDTRWDARLASLAAQVTFRYPHLRIIETANTGEGATQTILKKIGDAFDSYTVALPSESSLEAATGNVNDERITFKTLDIEADVADQGFIAESYGMLIASGLSHETERFEAAIRNARLLLKPGGYILMLQPLHSQRSSSEETLFLSMAQCNSILRKAGFSGIDTVNQADGLSVLASQAVDDRILALRKPLLSTSTVASQEAFIIGGASLTTMRLVNDLEGLLQDRFSRVTAIDGVDSPDVDAIPSSAVVLSLTDLDEPTFAGLTTRKLEGLKNLFDKAQTVLWVTRGCLADDPHANMIVGFGRTLLLETSHLRLQFFDIDPSLTVTANTFAEALLQLQATDEWSGSDLVWTTEPELALTKDGLTIPRVIPSQARNDRYNSHRREITKEVDVKLSTVEIESRESSSYTLLERFDPKFAQASYSASNIDVVVSYSCLSSLKIEAVGYLFLVLGRIASSGDAVLALSETPASLVNVPEKWCVQCDVPAGKEASFLSSVAGYFSALPLLASVWPHESVLVHEPQPALAAALHKLAAERNANVYFLTTSKIPSEDHTSWLTVHPNSSRRAIKSILPQNISVFVTTSTGSESSDFQSRVASSLPEFHRRVDYSALWSRSSVIAADSPVDVDIREQLDSAAAFADLSFADAVVVGLNDLASVPSGTNLAVVDWTAASKVTATLEPVDSKPLFAKDKTYFLVGLAGDLGQSLTKWMIDHGARYIVLTSRNPRIDKQWHASFEGTGAVVKICPNDITNKSALQQLYKEISETLPPIAGVANGAMVLEDTPVADMTLEKMQKVLRPKVEGSMYLDELFGSGDLDFFVFFSSVASVVGNRGQSSYSAANAFMCSLAAQRRKRGLAASVIDIGAIVGTGYLTREVSQSVQDYLRKAGYMWMSETEFLQVFAEGVLASRPASGSGHEVASGLRMVKGEDRDAVWYSNPKFQHCVLGREEGGAVEAGAKQGLSVKAELADAAGPEEVHRIVTDAFTKKIQTTLLLSADNFILDQTADDLGIDSLVAVTIRSWFSKELGVDMPVMKILGGATVGSILDYAVERLPADLLPSGQQTPEPAQAAEETIGADQPSASPTHAASSASSETELSEPASWSSLDSKEEARLPTKAVPMSFGQSRFWFLESLLEDKTTSNVTCLVRLRGPLRVADLDRAVKAVGDRHEGLRTSFFDKDGQPMQGVLEKSSLRLETKAITNDAEVTAEFRKMEQHVFDLKSGDTMRIVLLSRSPTSHHLIVAYHHINMDGVSFMVLLTDIAKAYSGGALSAPALQYPQFSEQQRKSFDRGEWKDQIAYWKREYVDIPAPLPILPLSTVTTRKPMGRYDFHKAEVRMDAALRKRVQNTCRKQKITAFHFYVAVFQALLVRLAGVDDLSIGIADAGRVDDEAFGSIGNYLNLLPLHLKPSAARSFEQVLRETKTKVYEALANSSVPVDVLFKELGVARSPLHSPLFQAFVDYRSVQETQKFGDCEIEGEEYSIGRTGYDIALDVIDNTAGDSSLSIMVQKALYTEHDAGLLLRSFLALVDAFSADVSLQLQTPPLFEKVEIEKGLRLGRGELLSNTCSCSQRSDTKPGPEFQHHWESLPHAVDAIAQEHPSRTALRDGLGNTLSYNAMMSRVHSIANALLETGITADSRARVAVFQVPSVDWICSMLAIMRIGAAYVPLDLRSGLPRLAAVVNECQPRAILVHADTIDDVSALGTGDMPVLDISLLPQRADAEVQNYASAVSAGIILYTSGSTGTPKGIALSHRALQNQMEGCISRWGFDAEVVLQQSAYSFDLSVFQIYLALLTGGTSVSVPKVARGDAVAIVKIIADEGVTATCGVPSEYITWLRYGDSDLLRGSNYRMMVSGGEPFSTNLASELRALGKSDLRAMNLYGPAEATISATTIEVDYNQAKALERPAPAGYTVPNYSIYILDENLDPVPAGVPGQIAIAGSISSGYVNNDALDKERFVPDPFAPPEWRAKGWDRMHLSGDKGRLRPSDGALVFEGRIAGDTQIKLRGIRIELQDVESVIIDTAKGAIATAIASVRGDPAFLVAHVVFSPGHLLSKDEQPEFLERLVLSLPLPQYMRPTIIVPLDAMPLTVSDKIDRRAVGQLSLQDVQRKERRTSELSPTETKLKEIWESVATSDLTSLYDIDADSDFFNVGGNSLLLMGLQSKIRETFGITLSLLELFEASSLARMAARINNSKGDNILPLIDWESETGFDIEPDAVSIRAGATPSKHKVIVLTGATGFLGKHILQQLLEDEEVLRVHCIALRNPSQLAHLRSDRLHLHEGNLTLPRLGLTASAATQIFTEATDIIHNAADVSFMKTYHSLKPSNVTSTKNLLHLLLTTPGAPASFHYISTAGIGQLSPAPTFHPTTAASSTPPPDGSNGYAATKWASERLLERAAQRFFPGLRVVVHRPSSITGAGAPALDVVQNLLGAARRLRALPALERVWRGWVDLVAVERVAAGVVAEVRAGGEGGAAPRYVHHSGDYEVPVEGLKAFLEGEEGVRFEVLERAEWVERARGVGINEMVAAYMEAQSGDRPLLTPRIAKG